MAAFTFRYPGNVWPDKGVFTAADAAYFDSAITRCLNAAEGGTWAPSSLIVLGGSGAKFTTFLQVSSTGKLSVGGVQGTDPGFYAVPGGSTPAVYTDIPFSSVAVTVLGGGAAGTDLSKTVTVKSKLLITSTTGEVFVCSGSGRIVGALAVQGGSSLTGDVSAGGNIQAAGLIQALNGAFISGGTVSISSPAINIGNLDGSSAIQLFSPLTLGGKGRIRRSNFKANSFSGSFNSSLQSIVIPPNLLSQNGVFTLQNTDAGNGDVMSVANLSATFDCLVRDDATNLLATVWANHWGEFEFLAGAWTCVKIGSFNKHGVAD